MRWTDPVSETAYLGSHWAGSRYWQGLRKGIHEDTRGLGYWKGEGVEDTGARDCLSGRHLAVSGYTMASGCPQRGHPRHTLHKKGQKHVRTSRKLTVKGRKREHPKQALLEVPPKKGTTPGQ